MFAVATNTFCSIRVLTDMTQICPKEKAHMTQIRIGSKKSNGKIDIIDAIINCFCSIEADSVETTSVYESERDGFLFF